MQIIIIIAAAIALYGAVRVIIPFISPQPDNLGVSEDGQLAPCPSSPNCVSTQMPQDDKTHAIAPITFNGSVDDAKTRVLNIVKSMPRSKVITNDSNYLHVEFYSQMMGFIDDTEFYFDETTNTIHFRSAARLGKGDMGVNRKRMESIRQQFNAQ